jgi:hypothetical protein
VTSLARGHVPGCEPIRKITWMRDKAGSGKGGVICLHGNSCETGGAYCSKYPEVSGCTNFLVDSRRIFVRESGVVVSKFNCISLQL